MIKKIINEWKIKKKNDEHKNNKTKTKKRNAIHAGINIIRIINKKKLH